MEEAKQKLLDLMCGISEENWSAGWLLENGYRLWDILIGGKPKIYGQGTISIEHITELRKLAELAGGWWKFDDIAGEERFYQLDEWVALFAIWIKSEQA